MYSIVLFSSAPHLQSLPRFSRHLMLYWDVHRFLGIAYCDVTSSTVLPSFPRLDLPCPTIQSIKGSERDKMGNIRMLRTLTFSDVHVFVAYKYLLYITPSSDTLKQQLDAPKKYSKSLFRSRIVVQAPVFSMNSGPLSSSPQHRRINM
jgi:hypothetical protein